MTIISSESETRSRASKSESHWEAQPGDPGTASGLRVHLGGSAVILMALSYRDAPGPGPQLMRGYQGRTPAQEGGALGPVSRF